MRVKTMTICLVGSGCSVLSSNSCSFCYGGAGCWGRVGGSSVVYSCLEPFKPAILHATDCEGGFCLGPFLLVIMWQKGSIARAEY